MNEQEMRLQRSTTSLLSRFSPGDDGVSPSQQLHYFHRDLQSTTTSTSSSSSSSRISPGVLVVIVVLAVVFFVSGLLHFLFRFVIKKGRLPRPPPPPSDYAQLGRRRVTELSGPDALQRQLQQLFHLHDSGLDQALIDALPVFVYEDLVGSKEPFDCAVCLCGFGAHDELRLLPVCGHAFHLACIDAWLLSSSTCPLCRGSLFLQGGGGLLTENPVFDFCDSAEDDAEDEIPGERAAPAGAVTETGDEIDPDKRVFPVRLGKFKSSGDGNGSGDEGGGIAIAAAIGDVRFKERETSSSSLDARRCFSMGSYQYVVADANLQVAFKNCSAVRDGGGDGRGGGCRGRKGTSQCTANESAEGKQLGICGRRESFSVSKIWLWSNKKGKLPVASDASDLYTNLPWNEKQQQQLQMLEIRQGE